MNEELGTDAALKFFRDVSTLAAPYRQVVTVGRLLWEDVEAWAHQRMTPNLYSFVDKGTHYLMFFGVMWRPDSSIGNHDIVIREQIQ